MSDTATVPRTDAETRPMNGSEVVLRALVEQGVEVVFGYPGGAVLPIYDALYDFEGLRHILVRQEAAAGHAAEGYARATGKLGVAVVTTGPGAANTLGATGEAMTSGAPDCRIDSRIAAGGVST